MLIVPHRELGNAFQRGLKCSAVYRKVPNAVVRPRERAGILRLASWNIERGHDLRTVARVLREIDPDVACLQEVDWGNRRTGGIDVLAELAHATGSVGFFGIEFVELESPRRKREMAGGGVTGNALLTRIPASRARRIALPPAIDWAPDAAREGLPQRAVRYVEREPRLGERCALIAEFAFAGRTIAIGSLHLENVFGGVAGRYAQFVHAARAAREQYGDVASIVLAGDFNTFDSTLARVASCDSDANALGKPAATSEAVWWQRELLPPLGFTDPFSPRDWTFRVFPVFRAKLDWIARSGGRIIDHGVEPLRGSDHRLIWADIAFDPQGITAHGRDERESDE